MKKKLVTSLASVILVLAMLFVFFPQSVRADTPGTSGFITRFYQLCLGREPDAAGLNYWVNGLSSGSLKGADLAKQFVFSQEFLNYNVTNEQYVTIMYNAFFNRIPDSGGYTTWTNMLSSGLSRYYVLAQFVNSQEFRDLSASYGISPGLLIISNPVDMYPGTTQFVSRFYQQCLGRTPDQAGVSYWVTRLASGEFKGADLANQFVLSEEFINRNVSDADFVKIMYSAFFNRTADSGGYSLWLNKLTIGYTRHYVLTGFVNSQEFKNLCASYQINSGALTQFAQDCTVSDPLNMGFSYSNGRIGLYWTALNTSGKTVSYVTLSISLYDSSKNSVLNDFRQTGPFTLRIYGPIHADDQIIVNDAYITYCTACYYLKIDTVTFTYADGSAQTFTYNWYY